MSEDESTTVGGLIETVYQRFDNAPLSYGHGTDNAWDEAVYLVLSVTGFADDEASLQLPVIPADLQHIRGIAGRRIDERAPLAHLMGECQFMGQRFFVEPCVMVPRSPIGYLLGEPLQDKELKPLEEQYCGLFSGDDRERRELPQRLFEVG